MGAIHTFRMLKHERRHGKIQVGKEGRHSPPSGKERAMGMRPSEKEKDAVHASMSVYMKT